jgi:hypothetical protein
MLLLYQLVVVVTVGLMQTAAINISAETLVDLQHWVTM